MNNINFATLISQLPHLQSVAAAQISHPETQQMAAAQMAQQVFTKEHSQVQKVEAAHGPDAADKDKKREKNRFAMQKRRLTGSAVEAQDEDSSTSNASPWAGHILNMKI